jgi:primosomal protein N' (replication factor Y)
VRVPFGSVTRIGLVLDCIAESALPRDKLRAALEIIDREPIVSAEHLSLLTWASNYYRYPIGQVLTNCLPALLRQGRLATAAKPQRWQLSPAGRQVDLAGLKHAPRQSALLRALQEHPDGLENIQLKQIVIKYHSALAALRTRGLVVMAETERPRPPAPVPLVSPELNPAQTQALANIRAASGRFKSLVLEGITGSGKTEVYMQAIAGVLAEGRQALVLVPEIGLTPQIRQRFAERFAHGLAVYHSGLSDAERAAVWNKARLGELRVILGTRSAVWLALPRLGIIVVDEEHDLSYKQQEGFRYSARDVAVVRAQREAVPVVLGSATPSLESLHNVQIGRYSRLSLPERAGGAAMPAVRIVDLRGQPLRAGLSAALLEEIATRLAAKQQCLLFINRRGYAPVMLCQFCGWVGACPRCDASMTFHKFDGKLRCHHCGLEQPRPSACPNCGRSPVHPLGMGTQKLTEVLGASFPEARILRIDRDSTRRKGDLEGLLRQAHAHEADILVGTQMLSKGHHFPRVTLVGIVDTDTHLFGADFRAAERLAQLLVQVAGRAGRGEHPGTVMIQTYHPKHPLLNCLGEGGYQAFARLAMAERRLAELPPFSSWALLRAEANQMAGPLHFLGAARDILRAAGGTDLGVIGPAPAPMARRAGRYRAQLLLQSTRRSLLQQALDQGLPAIQALPSARRVRWSVDVDPQDML